MAMTLVSTVTVGAGGAASIEFTNIPQTGKDLLVLLSARDSNNDFRVAGARLNGDSGNNYTIRLLEGDGSTASSASFTTNQINLNIGRGNFTANTFGNSSLYISNYTSTTNKSISTDDMNENNASEAYQTIRAAGYSTSSPITSINIRSLSVTLAQHSTASLYIIS